MSPPSCTAIWPLPPPPCLCRSRAPTSEVSTAGKATHHNRNVNLRDADTRDHHISHLSSVAGRQGCRGRARFDPHGRVFASSCHLNLRKHNRTNAQGRNNITYVNGIHAQQRDIPSIPCSVLAVCEMTDCSRCCFMRHAATCKIYAQQNETILVPRQPHKTHLCLRFRQTANTFVGVHSHCAVPQPLPLLLDGSGLDTKAQT